MFKAEYNILLCKSLRINTLIKSEAGHACPRRMGKSLLCVCLSFISLRRERNFPRLLVDPMGGNCEPPSQQQVTGFI